MSINLGKVRQTGYAVKYKSETIGLVEDVKNGLKLSYKERKTGATGNVVLGMRFDDLKGSLKITVSEVNAEQVQRLSPWPAVNGGISLTPPLNYDLYEGAGLLVLHPLDKTNEDGTEDTSDDVYFVKAAPMTLPALPSRDGQKEDRWETEFVFFPDRALLPNKLFWGGYGSAS